MLDADADAEAEAEPEAPLVLRVEELAEGLAKDPPPTGRASSTNRRPLGEPKEAKAETLPVVRSMVPSVPLSVSESLGTEVKACPAVK